METAALKSLCGKLQRLKYATRLKDLLGLWLPLSTAKTSITGGQTKTLLITSSFGR